MIQALYKIARSNGIEIINFPLCHKKAFCLHSEYGKFIAIDFDAIKSERETAEILAEEIAHLKYGLLYSISDCINNPDKVRKIEAQTKRKAAALIASLSVRVAA